MYKYGFELEGFCLVDGNLTVPDKKYPVDGFPGLIELRTYGAHNLSEAYWKIFDKYVQYPELTWVCFNRSEATFTPEQKRQIRKHSGYHKPEVDVQNLYGKKPKALGNKTIASCQINISNQISDERNRIENNKICRDPAEYGLLDVGRIVRSLDQAFSQEIKASGRQPGEYAIKKDRLEYRSLPNSAFPFDINRSKEFLDRIKKAVEG